MENKRIECFLEIKIYDAKKFFLKSHRHSQDKVTDTRYQISEVYLTDLGVRSILHRNIYRVPYPETPTGVYEVLKQAY